MAVMRWRLLKRLQQSWLAPAGSHGGKLQSGQLLLGAPAVLVCKVVSLLVKITTPLSCAVLPMWLLYCPCGCCTAHAVVVLPRGVDPSNNLARPCDVGWHSTGGTLENTDSDCLRCPLGYSTQQQETNSLAECNGEPSGRCTCACKTGWPQSWRIA